MQTAPTQNNRRTLGWIVAGVFALAMLMGTGPGILLVNHPGVRWFGLPVIYVWGLLWYAVQMGCVVTAYFKLWTDDEQTERKPRGSPGLDRSPASRSMPM